VDGRYATVAEVRLALRAPSNAASTSWGDGSTFDTPISRLIHSAEAWIDAHCEQKFDVAASVPSARNFRVGGGNIVLTDPAATPEAEVSFSGNIFSGWSWLSDQTGLDGVARHIDLIRTVKYGTEVTISARWGWPTVPAGIKTATIDLATHWFSMEENISRSQNFNGVYQPSVPYRLRPLLTQFRAPAIA